MNYCCSNDFVATEFSVDCNDPINYRFREPRFILENGHVYDENLRYMFTGTLEGGIITVNNDAEIPTFRETLKEATMLKRALKKQRRDEKRAKTT